MRKPIVRYSEGYIRVPPYMMGGPSAGVPYARLFTINGEYRETTQVFDATYNESGQLIRVETRNTIYIKVAQ